MQQFYAYYSIVVELVFILNHYHWTKIKENVHTLIPLKITEKECFSGKLEFTLFLARAGARAYVSMLEMNYSIVVELDFILSDYHWTKIEENIHTFIPLENHRKRCFSGKLEFILFSARAGARARTFRC